MSDLLNFRLYAKIRLSRPYESGKDYLSPGGYEMTMNGRSVSFDFEDSCGWSDDEDPTIMYVLQKNPDYSAFPDLLDLSAEDLENITHIEEYYIYLDDESDLEVTEIISACFEIYDGNAFRRYPIPEDVLRRYNERRETEA